MRVWQIVLRSVSGSKISSVELKLFLLVAWQFTLAFYGNKMRQTELKTSVSLPPSKQLLCEIYIRNTCGVKRKHSQYDWRKKNPRVFLNTVHLLDRDIWFTNTVTLPIYSVRAFTDAKSSLPIYSVRAFSDETSSLPTYSVRALFWQIEIWSGIYTVYFNCKYFTSLYFIYAQAIRMPPRDFSSKQNPCRGN